MFLGEGERDGRAMPRARWALSSVETTEREKEGETDMETVTDSNRTTARLDPSGPEALLRAQEIAARIPDREIVPIRVDVSEAALGVQGQMPAIEAHRAAIVAVFGAEGDDAIDAVVPAARALNLANAKLSASVDQDLEPMSESLREK